MTKLRFKPFFVEKLKYYKQNKIMNGNLLKNHERKHSHNHIREINWKKNLPYIK